MPATASPLPESLQSKLAAITAANEKTGASNNADYMLAQLRGLLHLPAEATMGELNEALGRLATMPPDGQPDDEERAAENAETIARLKNTPTLAIDTVRQVFSLPPDADTAAINQRLLEVSLAIEADRAALALTPAEWEQLRQHERGEPLLDRQTLCRLLRRPDDAGTSDINTAIAAAVSGGKLTSSPALTTLAARTLPISTVELEVRQRLGLSAESWAGGDPAAGKLRALSAGIPKFIAITPGDREIMQRLGLTEAQWLRGNAA